MSAAVTPAFIGATRVDRIVESEGPFTAPDFLLPGVSAALIEANADWLVPRYVYEGQLVMSFQSFVLRTARHTILVDACVGNDKERPLRPGWHRQRRPFLGTLGSAGVRPEEVDYVFCTHLHADHVGWNTRLEGGRWVPTFPNARYLFARTEYEHWEREHRAALASGVPAPNHDSFADSVLPVVEAGRALLVEGDHELERGVQLEPAPGHTPGGCMLHVRQGARHGVFIGDVLHTPVQLADPALSSRFCSDPVASARTRRALCERYADSDSRIFPAHFPGAAAHRIVRHRSAFRVGD